MFPLRRYNWPGPSDERELRLLRTWTAHAGMTRMREVVGRGVDDALRQRELILAESIRPERLHRHDADRRWTGEQRELDHVHRTTHRATAVERQIDLTSEHDSFGALRRAARGTVIDRMSRAFGGERIGVDHSVPVGDLGTLRV